jgi:hypothetical protein
VVISDTEKAPKAQNRVRDFAGSLVDHDPLDRTDLRFICSGAALRPKSGREMKSFLDNLDAPSLHDDDIAATLDHLNSVIAFRRAVGQPGAAAKRALSGKCYEKAFGDPMVSIYEGPVKVGEMTEDSALAAGIPRCGA